MAIIDDKIALKTSTDCKIVLGSQYGFLVYMT